MAEEAPTEGEEQPKKKSGLVMTIAAVAVLTIVGGAGGWFLGGMIGPQIAQPGDPAKVEPKKEEAAAEPAAEGHGGEQKKDEEGLPHISTEENGVVQLEPITTNLAFPTERWVRLEVALLFKAQPDIAMAERIHQDFTRYLRTVTMQQIEGPRGFEYLKEDLEERSDIISEGKVRHIMFRTFVIE